MTHAEPDQGLHLQWRLNSQILVAKSDPICLVTLGQSNMAMGSPCKWRYVDIKMRKTPTHVNFYSFSLLKTFCWAYKASCDLHMLIIWLSFCKKVDSIAVCDYIGVCTIISLNHWPFQPCELSVPLMCIYTYTHVIKYTYIHVSYIYICVYIIYIHILIYIYIHMCIHVKFMGTNEFIIYTYMCI